MSSKRMAGLDVCFCQDARNTDSKTDGSVPCLDAMRVSGDPWGPSRVMTHRCAIISRNKKREGRNAVCVAMRTGYRQCGPKYKFFRLGRFFEFRTLAQITPTRLALVTAIAMDDPMHVALFFCRENSARPWGIAKTDEKPTVFSGERPLPTCGCRYCPGAAVVQHEYAWFKLSL